MVACGSHVRYFWGGRKRERPFTPVSHSSNARYIVPAQAALPRLLPSSPHRIQANVRRSLSPLRQASRRRRVRLFSGPSASACSPPSQPGVLQRRVRESRCHFSVHFDYKQRTPFAFPTVNQQRTKPRGGARTPPLRTRALARRAQVPPRPPLRVFLVQFLRLLVRSRGRL